MAKCRIRVIPRCRVSWLPCGPEDPGWCLGFVPRALGSHGRDEAESVQAEARGKLLQGWWGRGGLGWGGGPGQPREGGWW